MRLIAIKATAQQLTTTTSAPVMPRPNPSFSHLTTLPFKKPNISWDPLPSKLALNWTQYQGLNHWQGLLDPLDDYLRREILRYGHFVQAAYRSFDFDASSPTYATCRFSKSSLLSRSGMTNSGYKITKNLRATCGLQLQLPEWIERISQLPCVQSSWIGYVAVCDDEEEIARLGRRDVVIALRGTATCMEWMENLRATLTKLPEHMSGGGESSCMVESGFLSLYVSKTQTCPSLQDLVREEVKRVIECFGDEPLSLTITGHSLGAALAILSAYDITTHFHDAPLVTVVSFGGPRVGNDKFRSQLEQSGTRILRIVNSDDVITKVPGVLVHGDDVESSGGVQVASLHSWLRRVLEEMQLGYADVGQELRLSSRESPYLKKGNVATCHDLKTYLHLVNAFVSSSCPYTSETTQYPTEAWL